MDVVDVDRRWAKNITDLEASFTFISPTHHVRDLIDMLDVTNNTGRLHFIVTARRAGEIGQLEGYEGEARDTVGNINQTYARMDTCFSGRFRLTHTFTRLSHFPN